jgi:Bacterial membrane protein YfhO
VKTGIMIGLGILALPHAHRRRPGHRPLAGAPLSPFLALAVFAAGCALLVGAVRWWRPGLPLAAALGHVALTTAFFAQPLLTGALQLPTDLAYEALPWSEMPVAAAAANRPHNYFQADTLLEQLPFHLLARQRLLAGEAPLWSHELGTGQPLLGNGQSAPFAPLHLLALPLAPLRALTVTGAWQVLLGLLTLHALLLRLGAGRWGAALGAVAAGLSTYTVAWIYDTPGMAAAFVPGLLLGILLVRDGEARGLAGLAACALGLALSGHPETMAHAALAAAVVVAALLLRPQAGRSRFVARLAAAAGLSLALAAPALLPLVEAIPESARGQALARSPENFQPPPFDARFLLTLVEPLAMGSPPDGDYRLEWSWNEVCTGYAGLLVLALAAAGALALRGRPLLLLAGGLAALLVALRLPPLFELMLQLPVIGPGAHGRLREIWVLALALAAGLTLDRVAGERRLRLLAFVAIAAAGATVAALPPPGAAPWPRAWWLATVAGAAAALLALLVPRLRPGFAPLVVAAVTLDLFLLGVRYHPAVPAAMDLAPPPVVAYLIQQARLAPTPGRVSFEGFDLPPNLNALYGLWDPRGYDPMRPEDAARMVGWWLGRKRRFYQNIGDTRPHLDQAAHDFLAVRYLTTSHQRGLPPPWRLAFEGAGGRVWENPRALPLFFVPRSVRRAADAGEARDEAMAGDDLSATAWIGGGRGVAAAASETVHQEGQATAIRPRNNGFDLEVDTPTGGLVASSVSFTRGWQVAIGGRSLPAIEVDGGFLGFEVPPGRSAVRLRYRPRGWPAGLALCAAGSAAAGLAWWGRRRGWRVLAWL